MIGGGVLIVVGAIILAYSLYEKYVRMDFKSSSGAAVASLILFLGAITQL